MEMVLMLFLAILWLVSEQLYPGIYISIDNIIISIIIGGSDLTILLNHNSYSLI